jgi:2'-5' RNA ligase
MTLRFLGDIREDDISRLRSAVSGTLVPSIRFRLNEAGTFGGRRGSPLPSVYWVSGEFGADLEGLASSLSQFPDDRGRVDRRPFRPHITIARQGRARERADLKNSGPGPWEGSLDRLVIYNSTLTPDGPEYDQIATYCLSE